MKTFSLIILTILFTTLTSAQNTNTMNTDDSKIALQGYSPVSYLELGLAQKGLKDFKTTYKGIHYYFTNDAQKQKFEAEPERYLPQYGGYCAFGISVGAKFRVNPNKFLVKDGKYYLFLYDVEVDAQQLWLDGNHSKLVAKANKNWQAM